MARIRYRDNAGTTHKSIDRFNKHIGRIGKVASVEGYRYRGRYHTTHEGVMIRGENGTLRFDGFCWGYSGTGPSGLYFTLLALRVDDTKARDVAFYTVRRDVVGTDWKIVFAN